MRGEFVGVWEETRREIWDLLANEEIAPDDFYCELYRELSKALKKTFTPEEMADIIDDSIQAKTAFEATTTEEISGERALVKFFENAYDCLDELAGYPLANSYFNLLFAFVQKFNLRYELLSPCSLSPTLPGMFSNLLGDLRTLTSQDPHLDSLMIDFENAVRDISVDASDGRIKTCIQKQINLLEALGRVCPGVTQTTLGAICDQVGTWPHEKIKQAMKNLYGFASDYPGIRHSGTPSSALRPIEMRDMIALSILLAGFTPYLTDQLNAEVVYRGN